MLETETARQPWLQRAIGRGGIARSASIVFVGGAAARLLGFLFSVATARLLAPAEFGQMTYALAIVAVTSVLMTSAPVGLSRFLSVHRDDPAEQSAAYSNWLAVVGLVFILSIAVLPVVSIASRISLALTVGVVANLFGVTVLETYREVQRGLSRYGAMVAFYVLANLLQLLVVIGLGLAGWRSAPLFVVVYGLSSVGALIVVQLAAPMHLRLSTSILSRARMLETARFIRPILLQSIFFAIWYSADMLVVGRLDSPAATGNYAAAKALALALILAPGALATIALPQIARLSAADVRGYVVRALAFGCVITLPLAIGLALLGRPLIQVFFGGKYAEAPEPLAVLSIGMASYGLYSLLASLWIGLGRPVIDMVATGAGMVCTVVLAFLLVPIYGLVGGAIAFSAGSVLKLLVIGGYTWWSLFRGH
ncbi:MAG: oligosaccharide flippase family protein [Candidatus Dormiibacterota bacterium]